MDFSIISGFESSLFASYCYFFFCDNQAAIAIASNLTQWTKDRLSFCYIQRCGWFFSRFCQFLQDSSSVLSEMLVKLGVLDVHLLTSNLRGSIKELQTECTAIIFLFAVGYSVS